jgi:hypothetical protein
LCLIHLFLWTIKYVQTNEHNDVKKCLIWHLKRKVAHYFSVFRISQSQMTIYLHRPFLSVLFHFVPFSRPPIVVVSIGSKLYRGYIYEALLISFWFRMDWKKHACNWPLFFWLAETLKLFLSSDSPTVHEQPDEQFCINWVFS